MATGKPPGKNVVQTFNTGGRLCCEQLFGCRQEVPSGHK
ncbi:hypothetical protein AK972_2812 [Pseudomonas yamanorum]|nr:hypothetical protein AK972_2812 [Pseudomonas yamanorum]